MSAPLGAFSVANDVVVSEPDLVEPRRGFSWLSYAFGAGSDYANALFSFQGAILVQYGTKLAYDSGIAFTDLAGTNAPPDPTALRMQAVEAGQNFYYTSTEGIKKLDSPSSTPVLAGTPRGPAPTERSSPTHITGAPAAGWMPANSQTAYVATWVRFDTDDTEHEGQPSTAVYVVNPADIAMDPGSDSLGKVGFTAIYFSTDPVTVATGLNYKIGDQISFSLDTPDANYPDGDYTLTGVDVLFGGTMLELDWTTAVLGGAGITPTGLISSGSKDVRVPINIPTPYIDETYTVRVYRAEASLSAITPPRFQFYLANEHQLTAVDIAARGYSFTDSTPDSLLQDPLYTNTDDGEPPDSSLQNDNSQPPYCTDLCQFDSRVWGANYQELQSFSLALLGVGAPNGLQVADTITIAGTTYTGIAVGVPVTDTTFFVFTATGSPGLNVQQTAQSLALAVTKNAASPVDCYYTSGVEDVPGQMLIRARAPSTSQFTVYASRPSAWGPELTATSVDALTSTADAATNGLWYSKQNQPEAVPLLNRLPIGPQNCRVLRIQALRDKLFVFTDIAGIWIVSNKYPYENVNPLTKTAVLTGPDTLVNFNDALYALTTQGVAKIDDSGPQILSIPVESDIKSLFGTGLTNLRRSACAVGYESSRKYILAMPTDPPDTHNTQAFVYDVVTKCWTRWTKPMSSMVVVPQSDYLYVASSLNNKVSKERKNYDRTDYADEDFAVAITAADGLEVTLASVTDIAAGDLLYVDPVQNALVLEVDTDTNTLTMQQTVEWTLGAATVYPAIDTKVVYTPMFSGEPESWKHYREVVYHFKTPAFSLGNALFYSDLNPAEQEAPMALGGFGDPDWERFPWEQPGGPKNKRVPTATKSARVAYLSVGFHIRQAWNQWALAGYTPVYEKGSERETSK